MRAPKDLVESIASARVLVVGAGGIGCELLKNLVMLGVGHIEVVDMDEIDVSNLNRQFLFRKAHVSQPKSTIAAEAVREFNPNCKVIPHYGNIMDTKFAVTFFEQFDVVLNALDNLAARRHVNRLCLACDRPLIEAGSTGYLGQATVIMRGETECYDCTPKQSAKVYAYCTIRSTPDKPIHCIIWAKHLFDLIFGPEDEQNMLSDCKAELEQLRTGGDVAAAEMIYSHLFEAEIAKQAGLDVWEETNRKPPQPLPLADARAATACGPRADDLLDSQVVASVAEYAQLFLETTARIHKERAEQVGQLSFSKEDPLAVDFVAAAANLRMRNYTIPMQSRWDIQSMAGAIIPAIATTNAMVAGLQTMQFLRVLRNRAAKKPASDGCRTAWVLYPAPSGGKIVMATKIDPANPKCYVCGAHKVCVTVNSFAKWRIGDFASKVLIGAMGARLPSIYRDSVMLYETPEEGDADSDDGLHADWSLAQWGLAPAGQLLMLEDDAAQWSCTLTLREEALEEEEFPQGFRIDTSAPEPKEAPPSPPSPAEPPSKKRRQEEVVEVE